MKVFDFSMHILRRKAVGKHGKAAGADDARLVCTRRAFLPCNYIGSFNAGIIPAGSSSPSPLRRARCAIDALTASPERID